MKHDICLYCRCIMCFIGVYFITAGRAQSDDTETRDIVNALKKDGLLKYVPCKLQFHQLKDYL